MLSCAKPRIKGPSIMMMKPTTQYSSVSAFQYRGFHSSSTPQAIHLVNAPRKAKRLSSGAKHGIPLTVEFPGTPKTTLGNSLPPIPEIKCTTLNSGLKVVTQETYTQATAVSLFIDAGVCYETDENQGICRILERMAFKATKSRPTKDLVQDLEKLGGNITSASSREIMSYSADLVRENVPKLIELMADSITNPVFQQDEIDEQMRVIEFELEEAENQPDSVLGELLHEVAFAGYPHGRSMAFPRRNLGKITSNMLFDFHSRLYTADRMILSVAGAQHEEILDLVQKHFQQLPPSKVAIPRPISQYVGGDLRVQTEEDDDPNKKSHLVLAFEGANAHSEDIYLLSILNVFLGGGGSFSAGGPGKGMYSRLYRNVLNGYAFVEQAMAFTTIYDPVGLIGIHASVTHQHLYNIIEALVVELNDITHNTSEEEFIRAKNQLKSSLFMNLESRAVLADDIGRQYFHYGKHFSADYIGAKIDSFQLQDMINYLKRLLNTIPTIIYYGPQANSEDLPSAEQVMNYFKETLANKQ
eukprot:CAMPEP_0168540898 /NCGR_PEP_ID=MMETSP0413-20121227/524_1 /TAXON_ID=136452 /ORGANISM="Filamoeba nolandi, Strain NC-AS-23-1" /LENGTH=527 /DNA_ID=CAMNT_0008570667 /DNA_START=196 /DNA_END=1779 /DNA_ORIENTATION=-